MVCVVKTAHQWPFSRLRVDGVAHVQASIAFNDIEGSTIINPVETLVPDIQQALRY
jgi:hypothetical protein